MGGGRFTYRWLGCAFCGGVFRLLRAGSGIQQDFGTAFDPMAALVHLDGRVVATADPWRCDTCNALPDLGGRPRLQVDEDGRVQLVGLTGFVVLEAEGLPQTALSHRFRADAGAGHRADAGCWCCPAPSRRTLGGLFAGLVLHHNDRAGLGLGLHPLSWWEPDPNAVTLQP